MDVIHASTRSMLRCEAWADQAEGDRGEGADAQFLGDRIRREYADAGRVFTDCLFHRFNTARGFDVRTMAYPIYQRAGQQRMIIAGSIGDEHRERFEVLACDARTALWNRFSRSASQF